MPPPPGWASAGQQLPSLSLKTASSWEVWPDWEGTWFLCLSRNFWVRGWLWGIHGPGAPSKKARGNPPLEYKKGLCPLRPPLL